MPRDGQLYKKVGRKYIPVNDPNGYDGLPEGFWLVFVRPGSISVRTQLEPDMAPIDAMLMKHVDELTDMIIEASQAKPAHNFTEKQKLAFDDMQAKLGKDKIAMFNYQSASDIARDFLNNFRKPPSP